MGTGIYGGFGGTIGSLNNFSMLIRDKQKSPTIERKDEKSANPEEKHYKKEKKPIFDKRGHVTSQSLSARAEFFLGKSVAKLENVLHKHGYETVRRPSKHSTSKAKLIVTTNPSKDRNVTQIQVSPGSKRHGNVPYVKISTSDEGKFKIIGASKSEYKSDGKETAKLIFRRKNK